MMIMIMIMYVVVIVHELEKQHSELLQMHCVMGALLSHSYNSVFLMKRYALRTCTCALERSPC